MKECLQTKQFKVIVDSNNPWYNFFKKEIRKIARDEARQRRKKTVSLEEFLRSF